VDYLYEFVRLLEEYTKGIISGHEFCGRYGSLRSQYLHIADIDIELKEKRREIFRKMIEKEDVQRKLKRELDSIQRKIYKGNTLNPLSREHTLLIDRLVVAIDCFDPPKGYPDPLDEDGLRSYVNMVLKEIDKLRGN